MARSAKVRAGMEGSGGGGGGGWQRLGKLNLGWSQLKGASLIKRTSLTRVFVRVTTWVIIKAWPSRG